MEKGVGMMYLKTADSGNDKIELSKISFAGCGAVHCHMENLSFKVNDLPFLPTIQFQLLVCEKYDEKKLCC